MYSSIIPYELAKLFGRRSDLWIPADMNYATKWHFDSEIKKEDDLLSDEDVDNWNYSKRLVDTIPAPTYAEVFDLLLEKHIYIRIEPTRGYREWIACIIDKTCRVTFPTWNDAANAAISEALKMIGDPKSSIKTEVRG